MRERKILDTVGDGSKRNPRRLSPNVLPEQHHKPLATSLRGHAKRVVFRILVLGA